MKALTLVQTVCKSWNRHKWSWLLAICLLIAVTFTVVMWILNKEFPTNVGFLVIGGLITTITSLVSERIKRPSQARDLARALYMELADRVARCCFDCEVPWNNYLSAPEKMNSFRLRKFSPIPPVIYSSTAGQVAILEDDAPQAPQAIIRFYFRLGRGDVTSRTSLLKASATTKTFRPKMSAFSRNERIRLLSRDSTRFRR